MHSVQKTQNNEDTCKKTRKQKIMREHIEKMEILNVLA